MVNSGLKQNKRRRDLCHFAQPLYKVPRNVFYYSFNPILGTLHGTFISHMTPAAVQCVYLNTFKDKLNIFTYGK